MLVVVTLSSSVFMVVRYHAITTSLLVPPYHDIPPGVRRRRRTTQSNERRKRPPKTDVERVMPLVEYHLYDDSSLSNNITAANYKTSADDFCGDYAGIAATRHGHMALPLNNDSKIVITGILHPLGVSLALRLHLECHVEKIIGVDALLPNTRHVRMKQMDSYSLLQKYIPNLPKLIVPELGVPMDDLLKIHKPTHVVHLANQYETMLENVVTMQQIMDSRLLNESEGGVVPHFTYVTTSTSNNDTLSASAVELIASTYHQVYGTSHVVGLRMPDLYGDYHDGSLISQLTMQHLNGGVNETAITTQQECLFVDDAVDAVVAAMQFQSPGGFATFHVDSATTLDMLEEEVKTVISKKNTTTTVVAKQVGTNNTAAAKYWLGWTPATKLQKGVSSLLSMHLSHKYPYGNVGQQLSVPTPPQRVLFPCASECSRSKECTATMLDATIKVSRPLTRGCKYVVYAVDLWPDVKDLPSSGEQSEDADENGKWCRIAFVSNKSFLVKQLVKSNTTTSNNSTTAVDNKKLDSLNGKVQWKNWTLVFVNGDASEMSEAEYTLLKVSPKRFFSETVARAMYVQPNRFPVPPFESLTAYFKSLDPGPRNAGRTKEYRSGVNIFRFLPREAKRARRVVLSSLEASFPTVPPKSPVAVYVQELVKREGIRPVQERLKPQLDFYTYAAHFVQTSPRRPEDEIRSTIYKEFPFHWIKTAMIVHDLREDEAQQLRCEWYDEHLFWGNSHLEDLSLAYILAKRRIMGHHDVEMEEEAGWFPIINTPARSEEEEPERLVNGDDMELFLRILPKPKPASA